MSDITLKRFMIFNSNDGHHESQEGDKLLYHWTKDTPDNKVTLTEQIDDVCLCDASVNISIRLNSSDTSLSLRNQNSDCNSCPNSTNNNDSFNHLNHQTARSLVLSFEKTLILIVEVEPEESIWMAVHVAPPASILDTSTTSDSGLTPTTNFDPKLIPTHSIVRFLNNIYLRFCLLNGNFHMIADGVRNSIEEEESRDIGLERTMIRVKLRDICYNYFNTVLPDIHLSSIVSNIASLYNYILYLDLNPITLMKVNSFINHLVCINPIQIRHTIVVFNEQLLWSSLNMHDTRLLYNYLVSVLVRDALQEELSREVEKVRRIKEDLPIYLTDNMTDTYNTKTTATNRDSDNLAIEKQISGSDKKRRLNKFYFTVFRSSNNMTLGLILTDPNLSDLTQRCEHILTSDSRLGVIPMASLAQSVGQNFLKANSQTSHNHSSQYRNSQPQQPQSSTTSTTSVGSNSAKSRRVPTSNLKSALHFEQKYIYIDKLDVSISWPLSMDMLNKEQLLLSYIDSFGTEIQPTSKKLRLTKYLTELDPEMRDIKDQTGSRVEAFFAKTATDSWVTVTNSSYRTIYSIHNAKNSTLSEAQQSAITLKSILAGSTR